MRDTSIVAAFDPKSYLNVLKKALPTVIHTEEQNDSYLAIIEEFTERDDLSPEEEKLLELLVLLVETFESEHYAPNKAASPLAILRHLMDANNLKQKDLIDVFGSEGITSEVLHGKREFSKEHIRRLAKRFHVSPALFFA